jgi:hypothetical protein
MYSSSISPSIKRITFSPEALLAGSNLDLQTYSSKVSLAVSREEQVILPIFPTVTQKFGIFCLISFSPFPNYQ